MPLVVHGLRELNRAFDRAIPEMRKALRSELRAVAAPVAHDIERMDLQSIRNLGKGPWSKMRVGVTTKLVYVAPRARGRTILPRRRPNLAVLVGRSMETALREDAGLVESGLERAFSRVEQEWSR